MDYSLLVTFFKKSDKRDSETGNNSHTFHLRKGGVSGNNSYEFEEY